MTELTRGQKIRLTIINNIMKETGMTFEEADRERIRRLKENASTGGKNGRGHSFGHGKVDPIESGRKGGNNRWRKQRS